MLMRCCYHVSLSRSSAIFPLLGKNLIENASDTMKNNGEERKTKRAVREGRHEERSETEFWGYPWSIWIQLCLMLTHPRTFHVELCLESGGFSGRCTRVSVPLRVVPSSINQGMHHLLPHRPREEGCWLLLVGVGGLALG